MSPSPKPARPTRPWRSDADKLKLATSNQHDRGGRVLVVDEVLRKSDVGAMVGKR